MIECISVFDWHVWLKCICLIECRDWMHLCILSKCLVMFKRMHVCLTEFLSLHCKIFIICAIHGEMSATSSNFQHCIKSVQIHDETGFLTDLSDTIFFYKLCVFHHRWQYLHIYGQNTPYNYTIWMKQYSIAMQFMYILLI